MGNGYFQTGLDKRICYFDVFFRDVPDGGGFAIAAGLEQEHIVLDVDDDADDAALRGHNVAFGDRTAHRVQLALLLFLRADEHKVEDHDQQHEGQEGQQRAQPAALCGGRVGRGVKESEKGCHRFVCPFCFWFEIGWERLCGRAGGKHGGANGRFSVRGAIPPQIGRQTPRVEAVRLLRKQSSAEYRGCAFQSQLERSALRRFRSFAAETLRVAIFNRNSIIP